MPRVTRMLSLMLSTCLTGASLTASAPAFAQAVPEARRPQPQDDAPGCRMLPRGSVHSWLVTESVYQNEELAFDGKGLLIAKKGEALVAVPAFGPTRVISRDARLATLSLGLRVLPSGDVLVAQPAVAEGLTAKLLRVRPDGTVSEFFTAASMPPGLPPFIIPNGLDVDAGGNAWVSDVATSQLLRISANGTPSSIAVGAEAQGVSGLVFDDARSTLFYTGAPNGTVRRVRVDASGRPVGPPEVVTVLQGTRLDGLTQDRCGNLYVVDSDPARKRFRLLRVDLDAGGAAVGGPTVLATFDDQVSGVQFGAGPGYDASSVYVSGIWGKVFQVPVGAKGAPRFSAP
ncbi:hypothetical protein HMI49_06805 [Corallococcus exercitus]|uniref:SMP-30/Gluconolactonase/LRE-like region domain-containing protein n=1 Tax=Corallococcus exercitus TaxID=2316736 RepID=A0A7Y4KFI5_9BACT|nr:hypothetical protein [Corallococcus exercitus]NOK32906.1 hypothetical protein [Corallococcus exercitus]